jgi:aquaglyceroporin related protein
MPTYLRLVTQLDYLTNISCFFVEFTGTMILALMIVVGSDKYNMAPPPGLLPLIIFLVLLGLGAALGMQTCKCCVYQ